MFVSKVRDLYKVRDKTGAYRSKHYYNSDKNKSLSDLLVKAVIIPELVSISVSASSIPTIIKCNILILDVS